MEEYEHSKKNIVMLGGGFGGLACALALGRELRRLKLSDRYRAVLIDRNRYHTFTPLLYEIATTHSETAEDRVLRSAVTFPLAELLGPLGVHVAEDEVAGIDLEERAVRFRTRKLPFAYLILALGAEMNYFDIPGLERRALALKTFRDALQVRNALSTRAASGGLTRVIIGGGGPTGIELAAEIRNWACGAKGATCRFHVTIIEAGSTILAAFHTNVRARVARRLRSLGVQLITDERIAFVDDAYITLQSNEKIPYDVFIWTGGVKPPALLAKLPLKRDPKGRLEVGATMACVPTDGGPQLTGVYAIGDLACLADPQTGTAVPGMARPAIMEGRAAAKNIIERIKAAEGLAGATRPFLFRPRNYPYIVPLGGKYAVAKVGPFVVSGFLAWLFKGLVELNYLLSILPWHRALAVWFKGLRIFIQNDHLG